MSVAVTVVSLLLPVVSSEGGVAVVLNQHGVDAVVQASKKGGNVADVVAVIVPISVAIHLEVGNTGGGGPTMTPTDGKLHPSDHCEIVLKVVICDTHSDDKGEATENSSSAGLCVVGALGMATGSREVYQKPGKSFRSESTILVTGHVKIGPKAVDKQHQHCEDVSKSPNGIINPVDHPGSTKFGEIPCQLESVVISECTVDKGVNEPH